MTKLINKIYKTEQWLKDSIEFKTTASDMKQKKTILCSDHHKINLIADSGKNSS